MPKKQKATTSSDPVFAVPLPPPSRKRSSLEIEQVFNKRHKTDNDEDDKESVYSSISSASNVSIQKSREVLQKRPAVPLYPVYLEDSASTYQYFRIDDLIEAKKISILHLNKAMIKAVEMEVESLKIALKKRGHTRYAMKPIVSNVYHSFNAEYQMLSDTMTREINTISKALYGRLLDDLINLIFTDNESADVCEKNLESLEPLKYIKKIYSRELIRIVTEEIDKVYTEYFEKKIGYRKTLDEIREYERDEDNFDREYLSSINMFFKSIYTIDYMHNYRETTITLLTILIHLRKNFFFLAVCNDEYRQSNYYWSKQKNYLLIKKISLGRQENFGIIALFVVERLGSGRRINIYALYLPTLKA